jgi:hypothetical protein
MYLTASNKEKVVALAEFHPALFHKIIRDLKNEHLKKDPVFHKKYFASAHIPKITPEEIMQGYFKAVQEEENGEAIAEHILQRWMLKEPEIYNFFEKRLSEISSDFTTLTSLEPAAEKRLIDESQEKFGALATYLFAVINSVCFSENTFLLLQTRAREELHAREQKAHKDDETHQEQKSLSSMAAQLERLQDKYEKKLQALERKYFIDTDGLKKQIAKLQQRLSLIERR